MGQEDYLGSILVGDFVFNYFMGALSKSVVVGVSANNVGIAVKNTLSMVA